MPQRYSQSCYRHRTRFHHAPLRAFVVTYLLGALAVGFAHAQSITVLESGGAPSSQAPPTEQATEPASSNEQSSASAAPPSVSRPRMSDVAELDRLIELYMAGDYSSCETDLALFLQLDHPNAFTDPAIIERGRLYFSTCALLLGHRQQARDALRAALEENPLMPAPDSLTFPPPVVSLFLEVRDEVQQLIADREREQVLRLRRENEIARRKAEERRIREERLEQLATQEWVVRKNSRFLALVPFGTGQFQNGDPNLGAFFAISQGLSAASAITSGLILEGLTRSQYKSPPPIKERYDNQTDAAYQVMKWSTWSFVGLYAISVLDAQLRFKKEVRLQMRERPLPPELRSDEDADDQADSSDRSSSYEPQAHRPSLQVAPTIAVLPKGGYFGLAGSF